jgi:hypothetical protein
MGAGGIGLFSPKAIVIPSEARNLLFSDKAQTIRRQGLPKSGFLPRLERFSFGVTST